MLDLKKCRLCDSTSLTTVAEFEGMPTNLWPTNNGGNREKACDLVSYYCTSCGHLQIQNLSEEFIRRLYCNEYLNMNSDLMNLERMQILKKSLSFDSAKILDVGGGTNSSHMLFRESYFTIIDPQPSRVVQANYIQGLISEVSLDLESYDYVFAFHVIEHLEKPKEDLRKLVKSLKACGKIVIEVPENLYYAQNIPHYLYFHQHINLFSADTLNYLCGSIGLERESLTITSGRILGIYRKSTRTEGINPSQPREINKILQNVNSRYFTKLDEIIVGKIQEFPNKEVIFLGAGGSTTLLLYHCPSLREKITSLFDSDNRKIGKILPGTHFVIQRSPSKLQDGAIYISMGQSILSAYSLGKRSISIDVLECIAGLRCDD